MRRCLILVCLVVLAACDSSSVFKEKLRDEGRSRIIDYAVWLPITSNTSSPKTPLVLLSHGSGGTYANHRWIIDALVANGFMVAGPNHPRNTTGDNDDSGVVSVWDRPADMTLLLDYLLEESVWKERIDTDRIGAMGFSSGGYTVIALAGGVYHRELMSAYCNSPRKGKECGLASDTSGVDYSKSSAVYMDDRIGAIFAMAPAIGAAVSAESLEQIGVPVYIIAAADDEVVDVKHGAMRYAHYISEATLELVPVGGHFLFLDCGFVTSMVDIFTEDLDLCGKNFDVDRANIQAKVAETAVNFFNTQLDVKAKLILEQSLN